jgi:hypothetical protein
MKHSQVRAGQHVGEHLTVHRATSEEKKEGGVTICARAEERGGSGQRQPRHRRLERRSHDLNSSHDCHHSARFDAAFCSNSHAAQLNRNRMRRHSYLQLAFVVADSCAVRALGLVLLEKIPHSVLRVCLENRWAAMADHQLLQLQTPSVKHPAEFPRRARARVGRCPHAFATSQLVDLPSCDAVHVFAYRPPHSIEHKRSE